MGRRAVRQDPGGSPLAPTRPSTPLLANRARVSAAVVLVACIALTTVLGLLFYHQHRPDALDAAVDDWIGSALSGSAAAAVLRGTILPGDQAEIAAMTLLLAAACLATRRLRGALLAVISVPVAGVLADLVLKPSVGRIYGLSSLTFPSGHATGVFSLAAVVTVLLLGPHRPRVPARLRTLLVLCAYGACAVVSVTVVALDFHYFTDTIAGAATGTAVVLATAFVLDLPLLRRPVPVPARLAGSHHLSRAADDLAPAQTPVSRAGAAPDPRRGHDE